MALGKRELERLIQEKQEFYNSIVKIAKETHNCTLSAPMLVVQGKLENLKEIYANYYQIKKKDSLKTRIIKSIKMSNYFLEILKKRDKNMTHVTIDKLNNIKNKIKKTEEQFKKYQEEYKKRYIK